jgi:hypothetical protein
MSCYEWERGTFKLSVAGYKKFKKEFILGMQKIYDNAYQDALTLHEKMIAEAKGKRGVQWFDLFQKLRNVHSMSGGMFSCSTYKDLDELGLAEGSFFRKRNGEGRTMHVRPLKPRKSDFTIQKRQVNPSFDFEDAYVSFDDKRRTITWNVEENNHACDRAGEHAFGKLFFRVLGNVKWTRGTGGTIVGNDEYNRDDYEAGGGGNQIKATYGPVGKEENRRAFGF